MPVGRFTATERGQASRAVWRRAVPGENAD
jgi:hypothetical protein